MKHMRTWCGARSITEFHYPLLSSMKAQPSPKWNSSREPQSLTTSHTDMVSMNSSSLIKRPKKFNQRLQDSRDIQTVWVRQRTEEDTEYCYFRLILLSDTWLWSRTPKRLPTASPPCSHIIHTCTITAVILPLCVFTLTCVLLWLNKDVPLPSQRKYIGFTSCLFFFIGTSPMSPQVLSIYNVLLSLWRYLISANRAKYTHMHTVNTYSSTLYIVQPWISPTSLFSTELLFFFFFSFEHKSMCCNLSR